jgi:AICAR transformylase/IMP cyclohydrolase PurH
MAGYMRLLGKEVLDFFPNRVVNCIRRCCPASPAPTASRTPSTYGVKVTGVTVHFANEVFDEGPIIAQGRRHRRGRHRRDARGQDPRGRALAEMAANDGATTLATRQRLAAQVFARTSEYDAAIAGYLGEAPTADAASASEPPLHEHGSDRPAGFPEHLSLTFDKAQDLRYGENPHQLAAFFRDTDAASHTLARAEQLHGKELSYNNILDTDSAWSAVVEFEVPACVIVKHTNPCGTAIAADLPDAYARAYESDPISAYGGVVAFNRIVPVAVAEAMDERSQFVEVLIAPDFDDDALELLRRRKNIRLLRTGGMRHGTDRGWEMRTVEGGILVQTHDVVAEERASFTVPTKRQPTEAEWEQLLFAWKACKTVKSNAILLVRDFASIGVGAGQMSRVDSAKIAVEKAGDKAVGSVCASDAYMPFGPLAQLVEQGTFNPKVAGSKPARPTSATRDTTFIGPHRLAAKDSALSRRQQGFEFPWGHHMP